MLVRILDMVGQDVTGKRVDLRSRNPDGSIIHDHLKGDTLTASARTLTRVYFKTEDKRKWLMWEWKSNGSLSDLRCCYGGLADPKDWERYHLEVLEA